MNLNLASKLDQTIPKETRSIAIAVSGGADSMALCLLLKTWAKQRNIHLVALTVDHQMRSESAAEAAQVHQWLSKLEVEHHTLTWKLRPEHINQSLARTSRYELLTEYCQFNSIQHLFAAHHQSDQAETFFMRLSKSSGLTGLSGMQEKTEYNKVFLYRPLLNICPNELKKYLTAQNQDWIEDPSNQNDKYERNRWRKHADSLERIGLFNSAIGKTCQKLTEANVALEWSTNQWLKTHAQLDIQLKFASCSFAELKQVPTELARRIMLKLASFVRGTDISPAHIRNNLLSPYKTLTSDSFKPFTWAGCYWQNYNKNIYICREWGKCPNEKLQNNAIYDNRFKLPNFIGRDISSIGKKHWPLIKPIITKKDLPYHIFLSLPFIPKGNAFSHLPPYQHI